MVRQMSGVIGNDILELSENSKRAVIGTSVRDGRISMERIDESVRKILIAKYWSGVYKEILSIHHVAAG
ncbi:hypothetical protein CS542_08515 [Pedobacter sp. IW39]|nr:hypothetical protein CS542_08515 [Pedobacter sp. IW39]